MQPYQPDDQPPALCSVVAGRTFLGPLPNNRDLVDTIAAACRRHGIRLATFSVHGNITRTTLGVFDPQQQVYITAAENFAGEIVHCAGMVTGAAATPEIMARIAVADDAGNVIGGRLFSETLVFGAEIRLQEWLGPEMTRQTDPQTGLAVLSWTHATGAGAPK